MRLSLAIVVVFGCQRVDTEAEQLKPFTADCAALAEDLASYEIGNYAPIEERAGVVAAKRRLCDESSITKDEAECLARSGGRRDVAEKCAPRLFTGLLTKRADCATVVAKIRASMDPQVQNLGSDGVRMMDKMMPAMQESCEQDGWPDAMKQCIAAAAKTDVSAMQRCSADLPKDVQDKLAKRMMRVAQ